MKQIKFMVVFAVLFILLAGCSHFDKKAMLRDKIFLVSIYQLNQTDKESVVSFYYETSSYLLRHGGAYLDAPIIIDKDLSSPAEPQFTGTFPGNVILIAEFTNKLDLQRYLEDSVVQSQLDALASIATNEIVFIAKDFNPMGMMDAKPRLGEFDYRDSPAFLMINAILMKSFFNPLTPYRIMSYMDQNTPRLEAANVKIIMPLEKVLDVRGEYAFEVLFLSEWQSEDSYNVYHHDVDFIQLANETRNKAFSAFTESKAHIMALGVHHE